MTLKGDAKFKRKLTRDFENDIRYLVNFHASIQKSGNVHFHLESFCPKHIKTCVFVICTEELYSKE